MGGLLVQVGSVLSTFLGVSIAVFGGYSAYLGTATAEQATGFGLFAVAVVAGYRSVAVGSGRRVDGVGNVALFLAGAAAYYVGVTLGVGEVAAAGQALFALACAYFVMRLS